MQIVEDATNFSTHPRGMHEMSKKDAVAYARSVIGLAGTVLLHDHSFGNLAVAPYLQIEGKWPTLERMLRCVPLRPHPLQRQ
jgi:hypothetical protein